MNDIEPNPNPDESDHEQLVAYLDGELPAEDRRQVEQRLADDEGYRERLKELDAAWELLDELPRADVDDTFTRTTVAMIALAAAEDVQRDHRGRRWRRWLAWSSTAAVLLAAALVGYLLARGRLDRPNRQLVRDLPVIENVDVYRYAESVQWLETLDASGLFADDEELEDGI
jgi:anti-sigma factor RsiW